MAKKRLYEIARELKTNNSEILWVAKKLQIDVKNHMSGVSDLDEKRIRKFVQDAFRKYEELQKQKKAILEKKRKEAEEKARLQAEEEAKQPDQTEKVEEEITPEAPADKAKPEEAPEKLDAPAEPEAVIPPVEPVVPAPPEEALPKKAAKKQTDRRKPKDAAQDEMEKKEQARKAARRKTGAGADRGAPLSGRKNQWRKDKRSRRGEKRESTPPVVITNVTVGEEITVKDLAMKISKTASELISKLMKMGVMVTINQSIDYDTAALLLDEYGITAEFKSNKRVTEIVSQVDEKMEKLRRPPIITVMGHVDHGKTSLLDALRETRVTEGEAGGITQHIGAYQVEHLGEKMTFIDTPGHEAFTSMRARGARVTDIAILVVAADDGVMPQTIEAISHARAAKVPILVAINKMDKPGANPDRVMQQLTEYELVSEEWGGDTIFCKVSAVTGDGLQNLLEMILLISEMLELQATTDRLAEGFVIEAQLDRGRGPVATLLVREGTLKNGDVVVTGQCIGRVRAMTNEFGKTMEEAPPSAPVEVIGLNSVPQAGDIFQCVSDEKYGKEIVEQRCIVNKEEVFSRSRKITLEDIFKNMEDGDKKELFLILKGDVQGSVEALTQSLRNLNTDEVRVSVVHSGVGAITETDVMLASASDAIIIGFNVRPDANAKKIAAREEVDVRLYRIIYEAIDDVKAAMSGLLDPELREAELGVAEIRNTFKVPKIGVIAGCYVTSGKISNNAKVRIVRNGVIVFEGKLASLKRFKDDVKEVAAGYECGMGFERFNDVKEGDVVEAYTIEKIIRTL